MLALLGAATVAACGGGSDDAKQGDGSASEDEAALATEEPLDQSPFCVAIRALEALGARPAEGDGTPDEVLMQNSQVAGLISEAQASAPADAPADVQSLVSDYEALSDAIEAAAGDKDAAIASLSANEPEVIARFGQADAHRESFAFFAERCGTAPPP